MTPRMKDLMSVRNNMTIHDLQYIHDLQIKMDKMETIHNKDIYATFAGLNKIDWERCAKLQDTIINKYLIQD